VSAALRHARGARPIAWLRGAAFVALALVVVVWTVVPVLNLVLIALNKEDEEYNEGMWPDELTLENFRIVLMQDHWYLEHFWRQFANSFRVGVLTMMLTVLIGSLASFAVGRMRPRHAWVVNDIALLTYAVPASFLAIPFTRAMQAYGMWDSLWAVIAAEVTFATPYALLIFHQYGKLIPLEIDEAARVDGATPLRIYARIYLPLMAPALIAVGTYALLLAWNEYLYQFLLLASTRNMTVAVAMDQFFDSDEAPWNVMMATAVVYALPPLVIFYGLRRYMLAGLSVDGVKG